MKKTNTNTNTRPYVSSVVELLPSIYKVESQHCKDNKIIGRCSTPHNTRKEVGAADMYGSVGKIAAHAGRPEFDSQKPSKNARHGGVCQLRGEGNKQILVFADWPAYPTL